MESHVLVLSRCPLFETLQVIIVDWPLWRAPRLEARGSAAKAEAVARARSSGLAQRSTNATATVVCCGLEPKLDDDDDNVVVVVLGAR